MKTFNEYLEKSKHLLRDAKIELTGGGGCTGGGFKKVGDGVFKAWDGDCVDDRGNYTYHNLRDVYK